ncbi:MAG: O-antigen ligase family protein [Thermoleophilia bacterium]|nr:O-antigen ligase family protein [Thermoleophilia bacterium]
MNTRQDCISQELRQQAARLTGTDIVLCQAGALILAAAFVVSFAVSPAHKASLPWTVLGLGGSIALLVFSGPAQKLAARLSLSRAAPWLFVIFAGIATIVALFATDWPAHKLAWLEKVYGSLPSIRSLPWWNISGLQANQTGGILAVCTAFAFALIGEPKVTRGLRWSAAVVASIGTVVVFMSGSRAALAGLILAGLVVAVLRTRRWLWVWGMALGVGGWLLLASGRLATLVNMLLRDESLEVKMVARLDIWLSALQGIEDHFFTGIGLGVFNDVMPFRYPYETVGLGYSVSQAHNVFLDVALCLGMPGLIGFVLLICGIAVGAIRSFQCGQLSQATSLGILASLIAFLVFGVTDSISFGVPTSLIMWIWGIVICGMLPSKTALVSNGIGRQIVDKVQVLFFASFTGGGHKGRASWQRQRPLN